MVTLAARYWRCCHGPAGRNLTLQGPGEVDVISAPATDLEFLLIEESIEMLEELEFLQLVGHAGTGRRRR